MKITRFHCTFSVLDVQVKYNLHYFKRGKSGNLFPFVIDPYTQKKKHFLFLSLKTPQPPTVIIPRNIFRSPGKKNEAILGV